MASDSGTGADGTNRDNAIEPGYRSAAIGAVPTSTAWIRTAVTTGAESEVAAPDPAVDAVRQSPRETGPELVAEEGPDAVPTRVAAVLAGPRADGAAAVSGDAEPATHAETAAAVTAAVAAALPMAEQVAAAPRASESIAASEPEPVTSVPESIGGADPAAEAADMAPEAGAAATSASTVARKIRSTGAAKSKPVRPGALIADSTTFAGFLDLLALSEGGFAAVELSKTSSAAGMLAITTDLDAHDTVIRTIAARDRRLTTALELMKTADRSNLRGVARRTVTALSAQLLALHPACIDDPEIAERLAGLCAGTAEFSVLRRLVFRLGDRVAGDFDGKAVLKTADLEALRDNLPRTAILIAASGFDWDESTFIDAMTDLVWNADRPDSETTVHRAMLSTANKEARKSLATLADAARRRRNDVEAARDAAGRRADATERQVDALARELADSERRGVELTAALAAARDELARNREAHMSEKMRLTSDSESLRVSTAKVIATQIEALEDAVDALSYDRPNITEEFVKRSVRALSTTLAALRREREEPSGGTV